MSGEIIVIVAVGVALGGLILTSSCGLRQDMRNGPSAAGRIARDHYRAGRVPLTPKSESSKTSEGVS